MFYYFLVVLTAFLSAVSQIMLNLSNKREHKGRIFEYLNPLVIGSYVILALVLVLNSYVLKYISMMNAHIVAASTYVFVLILSKLILKEQITTRKIVGNAIIIVGIIIFLL